MLAAPDESCATLSCSAITDRKTATVILAPRRGRVWLLGGSTGAVQDAGGGADVHVQRDAVVGVAITVVNVSAGGWAEDAARIISAFPACGHPQPARHVAGSVLTLAPHEC